LVLNGDTFFEVSLADMLAFHQACQSEWTFALFRMDQSDRYMGTRVTANGCIEALRTGSEGQSSMLANGGVYLVEPSILNEPNFLARDKASLENDILPELHGRGARMFGYESPGRFIDIGVPADYFRAGEFLANK
jgi:D-glycero-alpha-D-manno-heptose 1-phosphate guanylyltransferase